MVLGPIDKACIPRCFQPSVHSKTASSIFCPWVWKMAFSCFERPQILSTPGRLYVCMYVCMYACMHLCIHMHICMHVRMYACMHAYLSTHAHVYIYIYMHMHACMHACMYVTYVCMYACMYVCRHVCMHICIHMHISMHVCMYACMYVCVCIYIYFCCMQIYTYSTSERKGRDRFACGNPCGRRPSSPRASPGKRPMEPVPCSRWTTQTPRTEAGFGWVARRVYALAGGVLVGLVGIMH